MIIFAKMRRITEILIFLTAALSLSSCRPDQAVNGAFKGRYTDVLIYCGLGYNDLSEDLLTNLDELCQSSVPTKTANKALLAFCHNIAESGDYSTGTSPYLIWIYSKKGKVVMDTLKTYPVGSVSASKDMLRQMLEDVKEEFPSSRTGMILSSHGLGWIPDNYSTSTEGANRYSTLSLSYPEESFPRTKWIGAQYEGSTSDITVIELQDFAQAFPYKLDYLILDACLMGGVEVAYELKDVCSSLIFSPCEILTTGFVYDTLNKNLLSGSSPDLKQVCQDYYDCYMEKSGLYQSATITMVDCSRIGIVANAFSKIVSRHKTELKGLEALVADRFGYKTPAAGRSKVQGYFYDSKRWFYDIRDLAANIGATESELQELDSALSLAVGCHFETPKFFNTSLERCCGLSVYLPEDDWPKLNAFYKTLAWDKAVGLVD